MEETIIAAKAEMEAAHANGKNIHQLARNLQLAIVAAKPGVKRGYKTEVRHVYCVLKRVNEHADEVLGQNKHSKTGTIKVGGLSHKHCK